MILRRMAFISLPAICLALGMSDAAVAGNLVTNGSFETNGGTGQIGFNTTLADWSLPLPNGSYAFLYAPGTADTTGAVGEYGTVALWGPGNGSANGLPATSPDGGYYLAEDSAFQVGLLSQTISGLVATQSYTVGFWWAAAQQFGYGGTTQSGWMVDLGGSPIQSTGLATIPSGGFSGWTYQTFNFTATSSSELLSFLAYGGPDGTIPPFALLDGVSLASVPEPSAVSMLVVGLLGLGAVRLRRRV